MRPTKFWKYKFFGLLANWFFVQKIFFSRSFFFSGAENYVVRVSDRGNGRVHMTRVSCNSTEPDLTKCRYRRVLTSSLHYRDVGVRCYSGGKEF